MLNNTNIEAVITGRLPGLAMLPLPCLASALGCECIDRWLHRVEIPYPHGRCLAQFLCPDHYLHIQPHKLGLLVSCSLFYSTLSDPASDALLLPTGMLLSIAIISARMSRIG